jgi:hypothetical protein
MAATLVLSYALAEASALDRLELDSQSVAGIEDWGGELLRASGKGWGDVAAERASPCMARISRRAVPCPSWLARTAIGGPSRK